MAFVIVVETEGIDVRTLRSQEDHHCHCESSSRSGDSERVCVESVRSKRECEGK